MQDSAQFVQLAQTLCYDLARAKKATDGKKCAEQMYFKRGPKMDPLRIESGPFWRVCFWSVYFIRCAEALQAAMFAKFQA